MSANTTYNIHPDFDWHIDREWLAEFIDFETIAAERLDCVSIESITITDREVTFVSDELGTGHMNLADALDGRAFDCLAWQLTFAYMDSANCKEVILDTPALVSMRREYGGCEARIDAVRVNEDESISYRFTDTEIWISAECCANDQDGLVELIREIHFSLSRVTV